MNKYPEPETLFWLDDDHDIVFQVKEYEDGRQRVYHFNNIDLIWCGSWNLHEFIDENPNWSYLTKEDVLEHAKQHSYASTYHVKYFMKRVKSWQ